MVKYKEKLKFDQDSEKRYTSIGPGLVILQDGERYFYVTK